MPLAALIVCGLASIATQVRAQGTTALADADYAAGHYTQALVSFERRAAAGDAVAAELARQMLYYGPAVYGPAVARDPQRAAALLSQAARGGRPYARYLFERLSGAGEAGARSTRPTCPGRRAAEGPRSPWLRTVAGGSMHARRRPRRRAAVAAAATAPAPARARRRAARGRHARRRPARGRP